MKRSLSLVTVLLALTLLCGCSGNSPADSMKRLAGEYDRTFESTPLPDTAADSMKNLIDHYTGGIRIPTNTIIQNPTPTSIPTQPSTVNPTIPTGSLPTDTVNPSVPSGKCSTPEQALDYERYYLLETADDFTITITDTTDYSDMLADYFIDTFQEDYPIESMYQRNIQVSYTMWSGEIVYSCHIDYDKPSSEVRKDIAATKQKIESINTTLNLSGLSTVDTVTKINTYLCDNVEYPAKEPYDDEAYTVYGAVINNEAVCEGYAKTAKTLMDMNHIECRYITGNTTGGPHAWNMVKVNGDWYHLDITWNDSGGDRKAYFLVSDDYMSYSRTWDTTAFPRTAQNNY